MVTMAELESWQPKRLNEVADDLRRREGAAKDLQDELNGGRPPEGWQDDFNSDGARQKHRALRDRMNDIAASISLLIAELEVAADHISTAKRMVELWKERAVDCDYTLSEPGGRIMVEEPAEGADDAKYTAQQVADGIGGALEKAARADAELARAFGKVERGEVDGGTGSIAAAQSTGATSAMTVDEQIAYARRYHLDPDQIGMISDEAQTILAEEVVADIKSDGHDKIDETTVRLMTNLAAGEAFAHKLHTQVSPDEFGDAVEDLSDRAYPINDIGRGGREIDDLYKGFVNSAGYALATYTKAEGEYAPPAGYAEAYFREIIDKSNPENAAALTLLVRAGGAQTSFEPHFLSDVTNKAYEWERSHDGEPVWSPRDQGILDPNADVKAIYSPEGSITGYNTGRASDGLSNLLGGMKNSPDAAKLFFSEDNPYVPGQGDRIASASKMDYLLGGHENRTWDPPESDNGDGLGNALAAATVGEARDALGTSIADKMIDNIVRHSGDDSGPDSWFGGWGDKNKEWHVPEGMTDSLGLIGAGYADNIYDVLDGRPLVGDVPHLDLDPDRLRIFLGEVGHGDDTTGGETIAASLVQEGNERVRDVIHEFERPGDPKTLGALAGHDDVNGQNVYEVMQGQMGRNGHVLAEALNQSVLVGMEEEQIDANRAKFAAKAIDVASSFVPGAGEVIPDASGVVKTSYDSGQGQVLGQLQENVKNSDPVSDSRWDEKLAAGTGEQMKFGLYNAFVQEGYLHPDPSFVVKGPNGLMIDPRLVEDPDAVHDLPEDKRKAWTQFVESARPLDNAHRAGWTSFSVDFGGQKG